MRLQPDHAHTHAHTHTQKGSTRYWHCHWTWYCLLALSLALALALALAGAVHDTASDKPIWMLCWFSCGHTSLFFAKHSFATSVTWRATQPPKMCCMCQQSQDTIGIYGVNLGSHNSSGRDRQWSSFRSPRNLRATVTYQSQDGTLLNSTDHTTQGPLPHAPTQNQR